MLHDPLGEAWDDPEGVDADGDDHQRPPLDPVAKQPPSAAVERQSMTVDVGVLGSPSVPHHDCPWRADAEREDGHPEARKCRTYIGTGTTEGELANVGSRRNMAKPYREAAQGLTGSTASEVLLEPPQRALAVLRSRAKMAQPLGILLGGTVSTVQPSVEYL